eukprot:1203990-Rhodomonas_salina.1
MSSSPAGLPPPSAAPPPLPHGLAGQPNATVWPEAASASPACTISLTIRNTAEPIPISLSHTHSALSACSKRALGKISQDGGARTQQHTTLTLTTDTGTNSDVESCLFPH